MVIQREVSAIERPTWDIKCQLAEDEAKTIAVATLRTGARTVQAIGKARRSPADPKLPRVGEDLAVSRALSELAHNLLSDAAGQLETTTHRAAGTPEAS